VIYVCATQYEFIVKNGQTATSALPVGVMPQSWGPAD